MFGVLLVVIVTNGFSRELAGTLFAATSVFLILQSVALLGTDTGLVKMAARPARFRAGADIRRTMAVATVPVLGFSLVVAMSSTRRPRRWPRTWSVPSGPDDDARCCTRWP